MSNAISDKKKHIGIKLIFCAIMAVVLCLYIPFYNTEGVKTTDYGFLSKDGNSFSSGLYSIEVADGVLTFSDENLIPLTVTESDGFYTVAQEENILYSGREPDETEERKILLDGTLTLPDDSSPGYPIELSQVILLGSGQSEQRGSGNYLFIAITILIIWAIDMFFPDFFFKTDFRNWGSHRTPNAAYRKAQKIIWFLLPIWSIVFLIVALF